MDIIILCMNQKNKISKKFEKFYLHCLFDKNENKTYANNIYFLINSINGGLYSVFSEEAYKKDDIMAGTIDIVDFKYTDNRNDYIVCDSFDAQFFKKNTDYEFGIIYFINDDKKNEFKKLLHYFIKNSNTNSCIVLFRQGLETPEKIVGPIDISTFFEMIETEKIYENIEYVIKEYSDKDIRKFFYNEDE